MKMDKLFEDEKSLGQKGYLAVKLKFRFFRSCATELV